MSKVTYEKDGAIKKLDKDSGLIAIIEKDGWKKASKPSKSKEEK